MSEQRKISKRKVLRFSIGAVLVIVFMIALVAASNRQNTDLIKGIEVNLNEDHDFAFLKSEDIVNLLVNSRHIDLKKTEIDKLDLKLMEDIAKTNPWVERAEVFVDNREILKVNITQREPIARLFDVNGGSYYMDSTLHRMPVSPGYSYAVPVFTDVPAIPKDSVQNVLNAKIAFLSERIGRDSFWHAQVTQIEVQPDQTFIMIPLFGDQKIMLGDTSNIDAKLSNLLAFYKNISTKIGWDKYQVLDVRFKGQVVASPSIGWTPPKIADTSSNENLEGPPIASTATIATPVLAAAVKVATAPKPEVKVVKPIVKPAAPKTIAAKVTSPKKVVVRPKPAAPSKNVAHAKTTAKKVTIPAKKKTVEKKKVTEKKEKDAKSPKYIYQGKK
jgi:cell division protein FtsQ